MTTSLTKLITASIAVGLTISSLPASAHEYATQLRARKYVEVEHAVAAKLISDPNNADALIAKSALILAEGKENRLDEAAKLAEQCIAAHPQNSECHESLGNVLGTKAINAGIFSAMGYAGKIRDAFVKAIELDPRNFDARSSLMQFFLQAPGIVGGSKSKAKNLVADTTRVDTTAGKLMQAYVDLDDDQLSKAENEVLVQNTANSDTLADIQRDLLVNLGSAYIQQKKYTDSERIFHQIQQRFPDSEWGNYGLGRNLQEQGKLRDAIPYFEKALAIVPQSNIYYRLGQCWQSVNDKDKAASFYEKALGTQPELRKQQKTDAEKQLKTLKA